MVRPLLSLVLAAGVVYGLAGGLARAEAQEDDLSGAPPVERSVGRAPAASSDDSADDEYNFSWLDPDKKVYVIQNRKYRKKGHFAIFAQGGLNLNNPYDTEYVGIPRMAFWFTEQFGFEAFYAKVTNARNSNFKALEATTATVPFVRETRNYFGGLLTWTPWYAKINFFNTILYFDWFVFAGAGQVQSAFDQNKTTYASSNYKIENLTAGYYGTGQNFFVTRDFSVRWDLIGMAYSATSLDGQSKKTFTNYDFALGVGYMF